MLFNAVGSPYRHNDSHKLLFTNARSTIHSQAVEVNLNYFLVKKDRIPKENWTRVKHTCFTAVDTCVARRNSGESFRCIFLT